VVEQYAFPQLQINGSIDRSWVKKSSFHARENEHGALRHDAVEAHTRGKYVSSGWVADALPAGFKKIMEVQRIMHGNHAPVTQIVFSDGLSAISIFIEPDDGDEDDVEGVSNRGGVNMYHKVTRGHLITVVGEVPPKTVMQVFHSVRMSAD